MTQSPRDDEPDDHVSRAEASDDPSEVVDAPAAGSSEDAQAAPGDVPDEAARLAAEVAAWEAIVANYGEAPSWEGPSEAPGAARGAPHPDHPAGRGRRRAEPPPDPEPRSSDGPFRDPLDGPDPDVVRGPEERFVPPPPPPLPHTSPARALAWFGLLGVPAVVLVLLVAQVSLPTWVATGFTAWFVGGFAFLVAGMRTDHDDPDDGAVV